MKNKTLLHTNLLVCSIIIIGFILTSIISYRSNYGIYQKDIEQVSILTADGIYNQINDIFSQPVSVSMTMANDSLLKNFLLEEEASFTDMRYLSEMQQYLNTYRNKYGYDSVFLVSANTNRYYHFNGIDRVLSAENPENTWYYDLLASDEEYSLNVDNDEAMDDHITVFVNFKIKDFQGAVLGIVGVGLEVYALQALLREYEDKYAVAVSLINNDGLVEISSDKTGYEKKNLFDTVKFADRQEEIVGNRDTWLNFWQVSDAGSSYVVTRYEPNLNWHLVIENDASSRNQELTFQFYRAMLIIAVIILLVIIIITKVINRYNAQIVTMTVSQELEYQHLLHETTAGLYENIFEFDITHNRAGGASTEQYFASLGIESDAPYDQALQIIAAKQIKEEYIKGYLKMFSPEYVLSLYNSGVNNLSYDFMITKDGKHYRWMRIFARIFFWNSDQSVRMISYRQDIDEEKNREFLLLEGVQKDAMTGLYNKVATEELIAKALQADGDSGEQHVLLICDIDNFKTVNDTMGHSFGDQVICEFAAELKAQFSKNDIVGRIGGDEFAVLMQHVANLALLQKKLERISDRMRGKDFGDGQEYHISCSIGVALFPQDGSTYAELFEKADHALYYVKRHGKSSFSFYTQQ